MTAGLARRSPLDGVRLPDGVRELPFLTQVNVRSSVALTPAPNTVVTGGERAFLWLGPDEWLVVAPPETAPAVESDLRARLGPALEAVVDVSANRTVLELTGPRVRDFLESGCSLDLDPRSFGPGQCAQTLFARAQVILWQLDAEPTYRLLVRPSFAAYVAAWLTDAAA